MNDMNRTQSGVARCRNRNNRSPSWAGCVVLHTTRLNPQNDMYVFMYGTILRSLHGTIHTVFMMQLLLDFALIKKKTILLYNY